MTIKEQLDQVNSAVTAIESGAQEYKIGSQLVKRADLSVLYAERRRLQQVYDQELSSSIPGVYVTRFDGR